MSRTNRTTYAVKWVKDIPGTHPDNAAVEIWALKSNGEKYRLRTTDIAHLKKMREVNHTPASVTDVDFLTDGMAPMFEKLGFTSVELSVAPMSPKKQNAQTVSFPPSALEQHGTTPAI